MFMMFHRLRDLNFGELMAVYQEGNLEHWHEDYPNFPEGEGILQAEQDFYAYLQQEFFLAKRAVYCVWEEDGRYISALRLEAYRDGLLLEALETRPGFRCKGYARSLLDSALAALSGREGLPVYSHVSKKNAASLAVHAACGFQKVLDYGVYIDGSVTHNSVTLCRR